MKLTSLYRMARVALNIEPESGSLSFSRLDSGTRLVRFNGETIGAIRMAKNAHGQRVWLGVNKRGWRVESFNIRFLLRLMGLDV